MLRYASRAGDKPTRLLAGSEGSKPRGAGSGGQPAGGEEVRPRAKGGGGSLIYKFR